MISIKNGLHDNFNFVKTCLNIIILGTITFHTRLNLSTLNLPSIIAKNNENVSKCLHSNPANKLYKWVSHNGTLFFFKFLATKIYFTMNGFLVYWYTYLLQPGGCRSNLLTIYLWIFCNLFFYRIKKEDISVFNWFNSRARYEYWLKKTTKKNLSTKMG